MGIDLVLNPGGWPVITALAPGGPAEQSGYVCVCVCVCVCMSVCMYVCKYSKYVYI